MKISSNKVMDGKFSILNNCKSRHTFSFTQNWNWNLGAFWLNVFGSLGAFWRILAQRIWLNLGAFWLNAFWLKGSTLPPPFNIVITPKAVYKAIRTITNTIMWLLGKYHYTKERYRVRHDHLNTQDKFERKKYLRHNNTRWLLIIPVHLRYSKEQK